MNNSLNCNNCDEAKRLIEDNKEIIEIYSNLFEAIVGKPITTFINFENKSIIYDKILEEIKKNKNNKTLLSTDDIDKSTKDLLIQLKQQVIKGDKKNEELDKEYFELKTMYEGQLQQMQKTIDILIDKNKYLEEINPVEKKIRLINFLRNRVNNTTTSKTNEKYENEKQLISEYITIIKDVFEQFTNMPHRPSIKTIENEISIVMKNISESRFRLSYILSDEEYKAFITEHIKELEDIFKIFRSRCSTDDFDNISLGLLPYDKGLIFYDSLKDSYLYSYEKMFDIQKRYTESYENEQLSYFKGGFSVLKYFLHFCHIEDIVERIMITSKPINNIVFIPLKESVGPDYFSFYIYESDNYKEKKRNWRLDSHLLHTVKLFVQIFNQTAIPLFKQFYNDVFGHNSYVPNFEKLMEQKNILHWTQMKLLWENIQIVNDEHMIGEICRKIIKNKATYLPNKLDDTLRETKDKNSNIEEFKRLRNNYNQGLPAYLEEPEEYIYLCFDKVNRWNKEDTKDKYLSRWKNFLNL